MEAFSLLNYWKTTSSTPVSPTPPPQLSPSAAAASTTTIVTNVSDHDSETETAPDDGPFFDLEFAIPAEDSDECNNNHEKNEEHEDENGDEDEDEDDEEEVDEVEPNMTFSPSDDLFFNGRILQINGSNEQTHDVIHSGGNPKSAQFQIPVSLARSATKFRVFLLGLKRSKSESNPTSPPPQNKKFFTVKFKVEEVPIFSLLTRASSNSKSNSTAATTASETTTNDGGEKGENEEVGSCGGGGGGGGEEKRNKKEVVQKYLKMVKPLYVKVSKRNEKATEREAKGKMVGQRLNLKVIGKKHLGKSRSASAVHSMVQQSNNTMSSNKRDDSLLQQQDGIQGAILHCKRSFNSSKDFLEGVEPSSVFLTQLMNESLNVKQKPAITEEEGNGLNEHENDKQKGNIVNL